MRVAHFSDTHLGYQSLYRTADGGLNQRFVDVAATFRKYLDNILDADPDIVIHTGDFFDAMRPGNRAIVGSFQALSAFQQKRGNRPLIIVAGNHETPRNAATGCILRLFGDLEGSGGIPGVFVVDSGIHSIWPIPNVHVACMPSNALIYFEHMSLEPSNDAAVNIFAAHGIESSLVNFGGDFTLAKIRPNRWSYIALGDYHKHRKVAANAVYSGSTDYTSTNIWDEVDVPKGWILYDSDKGSWEFHPLAPVRRAIDLPTIDAEGMSASQVIEALQAAKCWEEGEMPIVRQRVVNLSPSVRAEIKNSDLRELIDSTLDYNRAFSAQASETPSMRIAEGKSLRDHWHEHASVRAIPQTVDRQRYIQAGDDILLEAMNDTE